MNSVIWFNQLTFTVYILPKKKTPLKNVAYKGTVATRRNYICDGLERERIWRRAHGVVPFKEHKTVVGNVWSTIMSLANNHVWTSQHDKNKGFDELSAFVIFHVWELRWRHHIFLPLHYGQHVHYNLSWKFGITWWLYSPSIPISNNNETNN